MNFWKPMLAGTYNPEEIEEIRLPQLVSTKMDGIRGQSARPEGIKRTWMYSRAGKLIPNDYLQDLANDLPSGLEFEIMVLTANGWHARYEDIESAVMSEDGQSNFRLCCFDYLSKPGDRFLPKSKRFANLQKIVAEIRHPKLEVIQHHLVTKPEQISARLQLNLDNGYEGLMLAHPLSEYKFGRCTGNERHPGLMKLKPVYDDEAVVKRFLPLQRNTNEIKRCPHGYAKRSSHKAGKVEVETLGTIVAQSKKFGTIRVGSGWTQAQGLSMWENWHHYRDKTFTFEYRGITVHNKPRHPVFKRFRNA